MSQAKLAPLLALTLTVCSLSACSGKHLVSTQVLIPPPTPPAPPPPEFEKPCGVAPPLLLNRDGTATRGQMVQNQMATDVALADCQAVQKGLLEAWPKH